uniref:SJCHGC09188 protein n=1 Tax=Schistosoma japonicum TaxID=6182 RepID=Q5DD49_SCHJA|nr:SJCHGC09188 protein [Schistosoma japonicum]
MGIPHYLVVGGGLSGLVTSYLISLIRPPGSYRLTVLESNNRWGGWIQSFKNVDTGSIYEGGPHSARAQSATSGLLMRIVRSLDLENSLVWMRKGTDGGKQFLFINEQLLPMSAFTFSTLKPFTRSNCSLVIRRLFSRRPPFKTDWTVDEFLRSRFDSEFAEYFGSAMMRGIFAGDSRNLSARACLPSLVKSEETDLILSWDFCVRKSVDLQIVQLHQI